jgi:hypothetical protein
MVLHYYRAPEVRDGDTDCSRCDLWAAGVILCDLICRKPWALMNRGYTEIQPDDGALFDTSTYSLVRPNICPLIPPAPLNV